jgi:hypothetical protein
MNDNNFNNKTNDVISKKIVQKGGEDINLIVYLLKTIPYCFFKALPHILRRTQQVLQPTINAFNDFIRRNKVKDETIISSFSNDKSCLYFADNNGRTNWSIYLWLL